MTAAAHHREVDAYQPTLFHRSEYVDVFLLDAFHVLLGQDGLQGTNLVTVERGLFEREHPGGTLHLLGQAGDHFRVFAVEKHGRQPDIRVVGIIRLSSRHKARCSV